MNLPASTRPTLAEHEPTLGQYRFFWPTDSSSSERHRITPSSSSSGSISQDQTIGIDSQLFTGSRGIRKNVDEVELFDDDWIDVGSKRQLPSKVVKRSKSSASSSYVGRTLQLVKKKQKQATLEGFMR